MSHKYLLTIVTSVTALGFAVISLAPFASAQPPVPQAANPQSAAPNLPGNTERLEPDVLDQGPLHEAFAKPLALEAQALVVDREPPAPINELPPEERPEGTNVNWLPGYWSFDVERKDFVWVSGLWRDFPPGRTWVPGEWQQVDEGFQWVAGFWADGQLQEQQYLPAPPANLEQGPSSPAPGDNYLWNPGCWQWRNNAYVWQPGFWYAAQPDWVWVPNHYCYTPRGSVYVSGYWDYPLASRGLVYAPVYWGSSYRFRAGYAYRPSTLVNTGLLLANLFLDSHHGRYYYGNHWGRGRQVPSWLSPWNNAAYGQWGRHHGKSRLFDPLYAHHHWNGHRHGAHGKHNARDLASSRRRAGNSKGNDLVRKVNRLSAVERKALKLHNNTAGELAKFRKSAEKYRDFGRNRVQPGSLAEKNSKRNASLRVPKIYSNNKVSVNTGANRNRSKLAVDQRLRGSKGKPELKTGIKETNRRGTKSASTLERGTNSRGQTVDQSIRKRLNRNTQLDQRTRFQSDSQLKWNRSRNGNANLQERVRAQSTSPPPRGSFENRQQGQVSNRGQVVNSRQSQDALRRMFDAQRSQRTFGAKSVLGTKNAAGNVALPSASRNMTPPARGSFNRRVAKPTIQTQSGARAKSSGTTQRQRFNQGQINNRVRQGASQIQRSRGNQNQRQFRGRSKGRGR